MSENKTRVVKATPSCHDDAPLVDSKNATTYADPVRTSAITTIDPELLQLSPIRPGDVTDFLDNNSVLQEEIFFRKPSFQRAAPQEAPTIKSYTCPSRGCQRRFKRLAHYTHHLTKHHPDYGTTIPSHIPGMLLEPIHLTAPITSNGFGQNPPFSASPGYRASETGSISSSKSTFSIDSGIDVRMDKLSDSKLFISPVPSAPASMVPTLSVHKSASFQREAITTNVDVDSTPSTLIEAAKATVQTYTTRICYDLHLPNFPSGLSSSLGAIDKTWSREDLEIGRKLVTLYPSNSYNVTDEQCKVISASGWECIDTTISCIWWRAQRRSFVTEDDIVHLLEGMLKIRFTIEQNQSLHKFVKTSYRPCRHRVTPRQGDQSFYNAITSFASPKPCKVDSDAVVLVDWPFFPSLLKEFLRRFSGSMLNNNRIHRGLVDTSADYVQLPKMELAASVLNDSCGELEVRPKNLSGWMTAFPAAVLKSDETKTPQSQTRSADLLQESYTTESSIAGEERVVLSSNDSTSSQHTLEDEPQRSSVTTLSLRDNTCATQRRVSRGQDACMPTLGTRPGDNRAATAFDPRSSEQRSASSLQQSDVSLSDVSDISTDYDSLFIDFVGIGAKALINLFLVALRKRGANNSGGAEKGCGQTSTGNQAAKTQISSSISSRTLKTKRRPGDNDDENDPDQGKRRKRAPVLNSVQSSQLLACPFHKYDSYLFGPDSPESSYHACGAGKFSNSGYLKQHLQRVHCAPKLYCPSCYSKDFDSQTTLNAHIRVRPPCKLRDKPLYLEKIHGDLAEKLRLGRKNEPGIDRVVYWYEVFDALFPGTREDRTINPYYEGPAREHLNAFISFSAPLVDDMLNFLLNGQNPDSHRSNGVPRLSAGLRDGVLQQAMTLFDNHLADLAWPRVAENHAQFLSTHQLPLAGTETSHSRRPLQTLQFDPPCPDSSSTSVYNSTGLAPESSAMSSSSQNENQSTGSSSNSQDTATPTDSETNTSAQFSSGTRPEIVNIFDEFLEYPTDLSLSVDSCFSEDDFGAAINMAKSGMSMFEAVTSPF